MDKNGRPEMHPDQKPDDPRARAIARAQEIMDHLGTIPDATDELYIPAWAIPDGWSYEWKTYSIYNEEQVSHLNSLRNTGWEPTPTSRHLSDGSNIVPVNYTEAVIIRKGNILMERPKVVTEAFQAKNLKEAREELRGAGRLITEKIDPNFSPDNQGDPIRSHGLSGVRKTIVSPIPD